MGKAAGLRARGARAVSAGGGRDGVAVVGVGSTSIKRQVERSVLDLACDAVLDAVGDAGIGIDQVDGYAGTPYAPNPGVPSADGIDQVSGELIQRALGFSPRWSADLHAMSAAAVVEAAHALRAGECGYVVVLRVIRDAVRGAPPAARPTGEVAPAFGAEQFRVPYGLGPGPARHALWWARYMHEHGGRRSDLYAVVAASRAHAQLNPLAIWHATELSAEGYYAGRWIVEPLSLFDCDLPVSGAVAFVLTTASRAREHRHAAHLVAAAGGARPERVFDEAGLAPGDVQVAQLYDGFSPFVLLWLERLGFTGAGGAVDFVRAGGMALAGEMPVNTFGGSLGEGRLHGAGHIREAVLQAMGRAGRRQVADVRHSLALIGIPESATALIFAPEAA